MPRGATKQTITLRIDPALYAEFRTLGGAKANFSAAVDEGIRWWIARERRLQKAGKTGVKLPKGRPRSERYHRDMAFVRALLESVRAAPEDERVIAEKLR